MSRKAKAKGRKMRRVLGNRVKNQWVPKLLLREVREARGIAANALAHQLQIYPCRLYEYETGRRFPSWGMLRAMARVLGVETLGDLVAATSRFDECYQWNVRQEPRQS